MAPRRVRPLGPPPNERPNWYRLNEGQRRYAWEQYNLARVRRGELFEQPANHVTETPVSAAPSYIDLNAAGYGRRGNPNESDDEEQGGEIQVEADVHRSNDDDNSQSSSVHHTPETSNVDISNIVDKFHSEMADKRPSSSTDIGAPPAKKTPAIGTGHNTDNLQPGGDNIVAPGPIERPIQTTGIETLTYRKVHRFLSFGLAYQPVIRPVPGAQNAANEVFMVTPMCEIPWDRLFMYMNPSEYNLLPDGARVSSLHIKIRQRNVRVAFQTNASTSELATLNQNKNILYGYGLKQYNHGVNVKPTFSAEKPMVANGIIEVDHDNNTKEVAMGHLIDYHSHVDNLYGVQNSKAGFTTGTPRHQFGIPYILPYYYACVTRTDDPTESGWPCFQEYVKEVDADSTSGTVILEKSYKPDIGLIKTPHNAIIFSHPMKDREAAQVWEVPLGAGNANQNYQNKYFMKGHVITSKQATESYTQQNAWNTNNFVGNHNLEFPYEVCQIIEKSQLYFSGHRPHHSIKTQPSLHIGVQPVPALSTKNLTTTAADTTFTDTQAYWEVICTAKVVVGLPTHRPLAQAANCSVDELIYRMSADDEDVNYHLQLRASMIGGLYATKIN